MIDIPIMTDINYHTRIIFLKKRQEGRVILPSAAYFI